MEVFALTFTVGLSTGHTKLIGLYSTKEKAEEEKNRDMKKTMCSERHYSIKPIQIDKKSNILLSEW